MVGVSGRILFGSPGAITTDKAERTGRRPVMNEARPAVQLACPYHSVNVVPSAASWSRFGVGALRALPPP